MRTALHSVILIVFSVALFAVQFPRSSPAETARIVGHVQDDGGLIIQIDGKPFARYVFKDEKILRPCFCNVHAPCGVQITRNHPPVEGVDSTDHAEMHPGMWLAFGDINGEDFWRNRGRVFSTLQEPFRCEANNGYFQVKNRYVSSRDENVICEELCRYRIVVGPESYFLVSRSSFSSDKNDFVFGDQEEMGFGVRVATPISVKSGGVIRNSDGFTNEARAWGKQADWCMYAGIMDGRHVGVTIIPSPGNFRRSWFHARDYGLLVANPFGRNAFTQGERSRVVVKKGEQFELVFGVLIRSGTEPFPGGMDLRDMDVSLLSIPEGMNSRK
ncbi:MAG TPA: PmoA family protein [bacterium]|nr:PmoA family protein [bacterium]HQL63448.1 PmoA family protein [bacterium]